MLHLKRTRLGLKISPIFVPLLLLLSCCAPVCLAWIEVSGADYQVYLEHPRLLSQGQAEWDQFSTRIPDPAKTDATTHYAGCENDVVNFNDSEELAGCWTVRFR